MMMEERMRAKRQVLIVGLVSTLSGATAAGTNSSSLALAWNCNGCHGPEGASAGRFIPSIAGMHPRYLFTAMRNYKLDDRFSTIMGRVAKGYSVAELRSMAAYYSEQDWCNAAVEVNEKQFADGRVVHEEQCAECHEDAGHYQDKEIPRLAGQWPEYLLHQMLDYQNPDLKMPQPEKMQRRMAGLTREDLHALSVFYANAGSVRPAKLAPGDTKATTDGESDRDR
jgi:sulfide dehydrogenase cytochrome subunit